jgi:quercetin dioxygenase-like cupin family protein
VRRKTTSDQTGGAYSLFEVTSQPGTGPPPHVHHREEEAFWVLEGEYEFLIEGRTLTAITGSLIYFPKGILHAHRVVGESVGRMLLTQTPGGLYERFFEEVGMPADGKAGPLVFEDQPDAGRIMKVAAEYGIEIPGPIT